MNAVASNCIKDEFHLTVEQAMAETERMWSSAMVTEIFFSSHLDEREIKGTKAGMRRKKRQMTHASFHEYYDHLGEHGPCIICTLAGGAARKIFTQVDPYKEVRVMHTFSIDTITWSHKALCGSKYEIYSRCKACSYCDSSFLYTKDQSLDNIEDWIVRTRSDPMFDSLGYQPIKMIILDNAGEWDLNYSEFHEMERRLKVEFRYTSKDRKEESAHQERGIGIKEPKVKAALLQQNLPPQFWVKKSKEINWLMRRFPIQSRTGL